MAGQSSTNVTVDQTVSTCALLDKYRKPDGTLDYDFFYNNPDESELQLECSIVRHMIGQIKIGMDLSKITLPTFILERRSLLEMYADHFAHPQLFVAIADGQSPYDRMSAALKWYMTSFHAGRNYEIAKKPYNPVLGENFYCYFDFDSSLSKKLASDGPVPWATEGNVTFYAEQVSHHPPVSAFYAEHAQKRIICNAHIWTKSRFYGLSIGVINAGRAVVSVLDYNEQYVFTFPSAYARSIMTVPYVELGGSTTVNCPQTGFRAEIEFITKSFYSSKRNRMVCKMFAPDSNTAVDIVEGDWTGILKVKKSSSTQLNKSQFLEGSLINVKEIPVHSKIVRPLSEQTGKESRYLWRNVTAALYVNNINLATKYKTELEQMQRDETAQRKLNNVVYESNKFRQFTMDDDAPWWYQPNLIDRLQNRKKK